MEFNRDGIRDAPDVPVLELSMGYIHGCAVTEAHEIRCWGDDTAGRARAPAGASFTWVGCGHEHCCALREDGTATCWGTDDTVGLPFPDADPTLRFSSLGVGMHFACGVLLDGSARCWGSIWGPEPGG